jgi:hypothetical protein
MSAMLTQDDRGIAAAHSRRMRVIGTVGWSFVVAGTMIAAWAAPAPARTPVSTMPRATALPSPCPRTWCRTVLEPGVVWSYRTMGLPSGIPRVNVVEVDPHAARVAAVESDAAPNGYEQVASMARRTGAQVAINGGFFDNDGNPPPFAFVSMLKRSGVLVAPNPTPRPALGVGAPNAPRFAFALEPVGTGTPDPLAAYPDAIGAGPFFVNPVAPRARVLSWSANPGGFDWVCSAHPRSAVWLLANGHVMFGAFDGGAPGAPNDDAGFWLDTPTSPLCNGSSPNGWNGMSLGQFILANFPTTVQAMNLDGGGSTTFVVRGQVVNQQTNGAAPRAVIDGLLVFPLTR